MFFEKNITIPHKKFEEDVAREFLNRFPKTSEQSDFDLKNYPFLQDIDKLLYDFDFVSSNEHTYNLNRAFLQTSTVLHHIFEDVNNGVIKNQLDILKENLSKEHCDQNWVCNFQLWNLFEDIKKWEVEQEIWLSTRAKVFKFLSHFVMGIDIVISVILIVLISKYGHIGESFFSNFVLVGIVFFLIVILKVFLDRFFVVPQVEKFWWRLYKKFIGKIRISLVSLVALFLFLDWANKHYDSLETLRKLEIYWKQTKR